MGPTFYFDADCGFCQWSAKLLERLTDDRLSIAPARVGQADIPDVVASTIAHAAVYMPGGKGDYVTGHVAIARVLVDCGNSPVLRGLARVGLFRPLQPLWRTVYRVIANNRHKLGPLVGRQACAVRA